MDISLKNCNNIDSASIKIEENKLNIKYAINGTGKSTIVKALIAGITNDSSKMDELKPFKHALSDDSTNSPEITGVSNIQGIAVFDEEYVNQYVFQPDEVLKNSFEIFIKTPDYEKHLQQIEQMVSEIRHLFQADSVIDSLQKDLMVFIDGFGKAKSGYSAAGAIGKGLGKGNKIANIPTGLESYGEYLQSDQNSKWLKWQIEGKNYLEITENCPYCVLPVAAQKETILKVAEEYDPKTIEHLTKMLAVFESLSGYFSDNTNDKIKEISRNIDGISKEQQAFLIEVKEQVSLMCEKLELIKHIGFRSLKDVEKVIDEISKQKIDLSYFIHLQSDTAKETVDDINNLLDNILTQAGKLQGEINKQKVNIQKTIKKYHDEINSFLGYAGYTYSVSIQDDEQGSYKMRLLHNDHTEAIGSVKTHLSYGEKNAFALVLFMYSALKDDAQLVILDDPISSFDENKKFAILNMLFMGSVSLKGRTVLICTHDFNTVIDVVYNFSYKILPSPAAYFLENKKGQLSEKEIKKINISSFASIAESNISSSDRPFVNKLIYLRRLLEITEPRGLAWQLLSNVFHKRNVPILKESCGTERDMTNEEISSATDSILTLVPEFSYDTALNDVNDHTKLKALYQNSCNNYEKLQIYRIIKNENSDNDVISKFVNETFHIENDLLFQLNPTEYEIIPHYIIDKCNVDLDLAQ